MSSETEHAFTNTRDCVKRESDKLRCPVGSQTSDAPSAQVESVSGPVLPQPVDIVRHFQTPKPYSGQTSHKSFKRTFRKGCEGQRLVVRIRENAKFGSSA